MAAFDEPVLVAGIPFRDPAPEAGRIRMRREQQVARRLPQKRDALLEVGDGPRVGRAAAEFERVGRYGRHAVRVNDIHAVRAVAGPPGPARPAWRMAAGEVPLNGERSDAQDLTIGNHTDVWNAVDGPYESVLRIVRPGLAAPEDRCARWRRRYLRSAQPLQPADAAGVVVMDVRVDDQLHVLDPEAERADVVRNHRRGLRHRAIDEH